MHFTDKYIGSSNKHICGLTSKRLYIQGLCKGKREKRKNERMWREREGHCKVYNDWSTARVIWTKATVLYLYFTSFLYYDTILSILLIRITDTLNHPTQHKTQTVY